MLYQREGSRERGFSNNGLTLLNKIKIAPDENSSIICDIRLNSLFLLCNFYTGK